MRILAGLFRSVGHSFFDLIRAELAALSADLADSGRRLLRVALLCGAAAAVAFWTVALILYTLVQVAGIWLPPWGAGASVAGLALLVTVILAAIANSRFKRLESPAQTLNRRWNEHRAWWRRRQIAAPADRRRVGRVDPPAREDERPDV